MDMRYKIYGIAAAALLALALSGCSNEEDDIFSGSSAERLSQGAIDAATQLESSPAGWAMEYYPTDDTTDPYGLGYLLLTRFDSDGSTTMAMNNEFSNNAYLEDTSAWEVITDNGIVLTYNTYNKCIHAFCDPEDIDFTYSTDETGYGCEGDYEFIIVDDLTDMSPEYVMLKGKKRGMYIRLSRLEEGTDFESYLDDVLNFNNTLFSSAAPNYLLLTVGGDKMQVDDVSTGMPNIYEFGTDAVANESYHPFLVTKHNGEYHFRFRDEFTSPNGFTTQELVYNEEQDCFVDPDDETTTLGGPAPADFLISEMQDGNRWQLLRTSDMSDTAAAAYENVYGEFSAAGYTLQYIRFSLNDETMLATFYYRNSRGGTGSVNYLFNYTQDGDNITFTYAGPGDSAATTVLGTIPSISGLLDIFDGVQTVSAATTRFNLTDIRLSSDDGSTWFVLTLN